MAVYNTFPSPFVFSACFHFLCVPSSLFLSLRSPVVCVLIIDISANGCLPPSRCFTCVSLYINSVCMQLILLYNPPPLSFPPNGSTITLDHPIPSGSCMYVPPQEAPPFSCGPEISPCCRLLFILFRDRSFAPAHNCHRHCLVRCSRVSRNQCTSIHP